MWPISDPSIAQPPEKVIQAYVFRAYTKRLLMCASLAIVGTFIDSYMMLHITFLPYFHLASIVVTPIYLLSTLYVFAFQHVSEIIPPSIAMIALGLSSITNLLILLIDRRPIDILKVSLTTAWCEVVPINWWTGLSRFAGSLAGIYLVLLVNRQSRLGNWEKENEETERIFEREAYMRAGRQKEVYKRKETRKNITRIMARLDPKRFLSNRLAIERQKRERKASKKAPFFCQIVEEAAEDYHSSEEKPIMLEKQQSHVKWDLG